MRFAVAIVALGCSGVLASDPGQPLDCSDWVAVAPGLSVETDQASWYASRQLASDRVALDNDGGRIFMVGGITAEPPSPCGAADLPILREGASGTLQLLACIPSLRSDPSMGAYDQALAWIDGCYCRRTVVARASVSTRSRATCFLFF